MAGRISYYGNIVTNGLVLCLDAAKRDSYPGVGTVWNDISGFRNNGVLTNGPTFNSGNGGSIVFDGVDDYVLLNSNQALNFSSSFTLSVWFKFNSLSNNILLSRSRIPLNNAFTFYQFSSGKPRLLLQNGVSSISAISPNTYATGNIYNFTTTITSTQIIHYINGTLDSTISNTGILPDYSDAYNWVIGASIYTFTLYGNQNIYSTYMYNRALSATEILQNYNATKNRYL
jgi:hypothetical protein